MKRKICVVTGTRAEYGLLFWLLKEIKASKKLELALIATGSHLSPAHGLTYKEIEKDFQMTGHEVSKASEEKIINAVINDNVPKNIDKMF